MNLTSISPASYCIITTFLSLPLLLSLITCQNEMKLFCLVSTLHLTKLSIKSQAFKLKVFYLSCGLFQRYFNFTSSSILFSYCFCFLFFTLIYLTNYTIYL